MTPTWRRKSTPTSPWWGGEHFEPHYASRELSTHGWDVLGDPKPWGAWTEQPDGSWIAYVDTELPCPRRGCETETRVFGCRWPYRDAPVECELRVLGS